MRSIIRTIQTGSDPDLLRADTPSRSSSLRRHSPNSRCLSSSRTGCSILSRIAMIVRAIRELRQPPRRRFDFAQQHSAASEVVSTREFKRDIPRPRVGRSSMRRDPQRSQGGLRARSQAQSPWGSATSHSTNNSMDSGLPRVSSSMRVGSIRQDRPSAATANP